MFGFFFFPEVVLHRLICFLFFFLFLQTRDDAPRLLLPPLAANPALLYPSSEAYPVQGAQAAPHDEKEEEEEEGKEEEEEGKGKRVGVKMRVVEMVGAFDRAPVAGVQVRACVRACVFYVDIHAIASSVLAPKT